MSVSRNYDTVSATISIYRYVKIIEGDTADVLTLHQRGEDGRYDKRTSSVRAANRKDLFLPPHLYGQLSKHPTGYQMLVDNGSLDTYIGVNVQITSLITIIIKLSYYS